MQPPINPAYYNVVDQIYHARWTIKKLSRREVVRQAIKALWPQGHPTKFIQVSGTSGKGSTSRFLEQGLALLGKAGSCLSPHLFDYRERFIIDGQPAEQDDITAAWENLIKPYAIELMLEKENQALTTAEINILIALALFAQHDVKWAVMETGIGGRYDQVTALEVEANLLTNVGNDHEDTLGSEQWQRVLDKAGSCHPGVPFFTSEQDPLSLKFIKGVCQQANAPLHVVDAEKVAQLVEQLKDFAGDKLADSSLLNTRHQQWNAALSFEVLKTLFPELPTNQILQKFLEVSLLGRSWQVEENIFVDVAHNEHKLAALATELQERFSEAGKIFVVGVSGSRSPIALLSPLLKIAKAIIITSSAYKGQNPQGIRDNLVALHPTIPILVIENAQQAFNLAKNMRTEKDIVVVTGSTYMIDQALNPDPYLRHINATHGWRNVPTQG